MDSSRRWSRIRRTAAVAGCVVALGLVPSGALATPGSGVTATVLAKGTSAEGLKVRTQGRTDVVVRTVTIAPGGETGWHYHQGPLIAVVQSGTLTRTLADCSVVRSSAGQSFIEPDGARKVHNGQNLGTVPVVLYVTYLLPEGDPLSVDAPDPGCRHY